MRHDGRMQADTYPRQKARTRGFQLGRPRSFAIAGGRVFFVRSSSGVDPVGSLWCIDTSSTQATERRLVDAAGLLVDAADLPAAERARRERMREVTSGITAFSVNTAGTVVTFAVSGIPFVHDVDTGVTREVAAPGAVIDPRIDDAGTRIAFVHEGGIWTSALDAETAVPRCVPEHADETWGLADFIAAEELERFRGHWWLGHRLLVERVDNRPVAKRWISDPAQPELEPSAVRYPAAGTDNAQIELWLVDEDGQRHGITWDHETFPYLASVQPHQDTAVITLLTRDQRTARIAQIGADGALTVLAERTDGAWVDVMGGVPCLDDDGRLIEIVAADDTYRLQRAGVPLTPIGLQVRGLASTTDGALLYLASTDPTCQALYRTDDTGTVALTEPGAFASAVVDGSISVIARSSADTPGTTFTVEWAHGTLDIANLAESPLGDVRPTYATVGERSLRAVVLWPTGHVPGSTRLPIVASPYGGPHAQRVVRSAMAFATEQWIADQGYAVVVIDGRGTPGRGPAWERAIRDDVASAVLEDQVDGLQALGEQFPDLDLTRVGIRGWSFGGYLAALAVMDRPDVFHAAVAGAPVTDWTLYDTAYTERYLGDPRTNPAAYERTSLITRADRLTRPLLLIHGLADDNVLAAHTLQLSSALLAAGRAHSVVPLSGVTHMTPQEVVAENLLRLEIDFFDSHLR